MSNLTLLPMDCYYCCELVHLSLPLHGWSSSWTTFPFSSFSLLLLSTKLFYLYTILPLRMLPFLLSIMVRNPQLLFFDVSFDSFSLLGPLFISLFNFDFLNQVVILTLYLLSSPNLNDFPILFFLIPHTYFLNIICMFLLFL
jgi:hypothetical protein